MAKNDAPENPLALSTETQEEKRESAQERQEERREQGLVRSFDRDDKYVGWDAQQGALPDQTDEDDPRRQAHLYDEDPVRYSKDQLPDPTVLREAGFDPVISRTQVAEDTEDATLQDGGPQTGNVVDEEARELTEVDPDAPRTVEDANKEKNEDEKKSSDDSSKRTKKKSSSKKSSKDS